MNLMSRVELSGKRPCERRLTSAAQIQVRECKCQSPMASDLYAAAR